MGAGATDITLQPHSYSMPPVIEALVEFRFHAGPAWDWTVPGLVYAELRADFPLKEQANDIEVEVQPNPRDPQLRAKSAARMQFLRADRSGLVQVGPDLLVVNQLRPYPKWNVFKPVIGRVLKVYRDIAAPRGLARIGLRYINRIDVEEGVVEFKKYLLAVPELPAAVPQLVSSFAMRVEIPFEGVNGMLILQTALARLEGNGKVGLILDLDLGTLDSSVLTLENALDWVEGAHATIETVFESVVTDDARKLFG